MNPTISPKERKINYVMATAIGGALAGAVLWAALGRPVGAAAVPDPTTCLPTCATDGRSLVVAGNDDTTLSAVESIIGLNFTVGAGPTGGFELFDGDRNATNWDTLFNCGMGCPQTGAAAPELFIELFADPAGEGGSGPALATWTPGAVPSGTELGPFPTANNDWAGVTFTHDSSALNPDTNNYQYAVHLQPANPAVDMGWNAFKVRAAGTVTLLGNQVVGFLAAMSVPGDLMSIYPSYPALAPTTYDGTWSFKTRLPAFLGEVAIFDGDMDFGAANCSSNDIDDPDSTGIPPFGAGSAAVDEGVAVAHDSAPCASPGVGVRTSTPAEDNPGAAFRRLPSIVPSGFAYQLKAPPSPENPDGQIFLNQNPSGNREWEQFKIQLVDDAGDISNGACPAAGYPEDLVKGYPASDCRTTDLPGGVWEVQVDGMDLSNLNFWFFGFKVEPIVTEYSIGRLVWRDANQNGTQDLCAGVPCAPELGIAGVAYTVYDGPLPGGNVVRTGVTDANGEFLQTKLPGANYTIVIDASNFAAAAPLQGLTSTTGGEIKNGVEVGLPECIDTHNPPDCGQPEYAEAIFGYKAPSLTGPVFVIGDVEPHAIGNNVNFWGEQWWVNNIMSGFVSPGASRASFKGFATRAELFCGGSWKSLPGNSPPPPATIPENVVIIVTSTVIKYGVNLRGNIKEILIVEQDGGYSSDPGHEGNGPVVSIICRTQ